jgi:hypothetical protein
MAAFLFVTASMAIIVGLVGLVAGHRFRTAGHKQDPRAAVASWSAGADEGSRTRAGVDTRVERR